MTYEYETRSTVKTLCWKLKPNEVVRIYGFFQVGLAYSIVRSACITWNEKWFFKLDCSLLQAYNIFKRSFEQLDQIHLATHRYVEQKVRGTLGFTDLNL